MKASDLLCKILKEFGVSKVFGVTGGSILHPLESAHKAKFDVFYTHHEQAASFAADSATRITKIPQACFVTTGPAGTNAMTGVLTSWLDSIPQIVISGQARISDLTDEKSVRQIGTQHYDVINSIKNFTNGYVQLKSEETFCDDITNTLVKAVKHRPGPVWIDIPLDLQWADIKNSDFQIPSANNFLSRKEASSELNNVEIDSKIKQAISDLLKAKKPLAIIGAGCKFNGVGEVLVKCFEELSIPMVFTWGSIDLLESENQYNFGIIGINGQRSANLAAYLSDVIVGFGTHLSDQITGRDRKNFAPDAKKYIFNIDPKEVERLGEFATTIRTDLRIKIKLIESLLRNKIRVLKDLPSLKKIKQTNSFDQNLIIQEKYVNITRFYSLIYKFSSENSIFISDGGGNTFFSSLQNIKLKKGQRSITSGGSGCMGSGLPHAIGASLSSTNKVYCFIGDGSMQFNIQELQTIKHHNLDITVILVNNSGYQAIIDTQNSYFDGHKFGVNADSGLSLPNFEKVVKAYGIDFIRYNSDKSFEEKDISDLCSKNNNPIVIEIMVKPDTPMYPKLSQGMTHQASSRFISGVAAMDPQLPLSQIDEFLNIKAW